MSRRRLAVVIGAVLAIVVVGAAMLLLRGDGGGSALATFSAIGRPVEMAVPDSLGPFAGALTGDVELIAERQGLRFVRLAREEAGWCWATADRRFAEWTLTGWVCDTPQAGRFPRDDLPVIVVGRQEGSTNPQLIRWSTFAGYAADGVRKVGIVDENDRVVPVADVVDNVFYAPTPPPGAKRLVALDERGEVIWRGPEVPVPDE